MKTITIIARRETQAALTLLQEKFGEIDSVSKKDVKTFLQTHNFKTLAREIDKMSQEEFDDWCCNHLY